MFCLTVRLIHLVSVVADSGMGTEAQEASSRLCGPGSREKLWLLVVFNLKAFLGYPIDICFTYIIYTYITIYVHFGLKSFSVLGIESRASCMLNA